MKLYMETLFAAVGAHICSHWWHLGRKQQTDLRNYSWIDTMHTIHCFHASILRHINIQHRLRFGVRMTKKKPKTKAKNTNKPIGWDRNFLYYFHFWKILMWRSKSPYYYHYYFVLLFFCEKWHSSDFRVRLSAIVSIHRRHDVCGSCFLTRPELADNKYLPIIM